MTLLDEMTARLGPDAIVAPDGLSRYGFDGFAPEGVVRPADEAEAQESVRAARVGGRSVLVRGSGTKIARFPAPSRPAVVLSTERLTGVVEYTPADMTVTVRAGTKLADLNEVLAADGQRLPLDPPFAGAATVGGILGANDAGPIRLGNGTARDMVVGMRMVLADGVAIRSGTKVVKDVAGYGLHKLWIGSAGTLGVITEVTFKLRPIPAARRLVVLRPPDFAAAAEWTDRIMRGQTRPSILDLLNAPLVEHCVDFDDGTPCALVVGFEDTREATDWQCERLVQDFGEAATAYDDDASTSLYEALRDWPGEPATLRFKATTRPADAARFVDEATDRGFAVLARAANGIVYGASGNDTLAAEIAALRQLAVAAGGSLCTTHAPGGNAAANCGWHDHPDANCIMRRIKDQFDPDRIFGDGPHRPTPWHYSAR